jgi:hypothetical protein
MAQGESAPTKYWLSTLPADTALATLVATAKLRWRIERDYQELKQELGLDHYEGRGWRGFHHHMALCVSAYGFLVSERSLIPLRRQNFRHQNAWPIQRFSTPRIPRSEQNATNHGPTHRLLNLALSGDAELSEQLSDARVEDVFLHRAHLRSLGYLSLDAGRLKEQPSVGGPPKLVQISCVCSTMRRSRANALDRL